MKGFMERFKKKVSPLTFMRMALALSGIWFLVIYPAMNWFCPNRLPVSLRPTVCDFGQYYAGATAAKYGIWDALYPTPKPEVYNAPPAFRPKYKTFLFDERKINGKQCYYPPISYAEASDFSPKLVAHCKELKWFSFRYMYPPPLALLLRPLACFDYETARKHVWPILSMAALFGLSYFSSRMHRLLRGKVSYIEGLMILAFTFYSFRGPTAIEGGNVTPILGFLIAFAAYSWVRGWQVGAGAAMIPLLLCKAIGLNWCPLLFLGRVRWKTFWTLAFLTVLLNGLMLFWAGIGVYRQFLFEVLPKVSVPIGYGVVPMIFQAFGFYPAKFYLGLNVLLCLFLYYGYWRGTKAKGSVDRLVAMAATLAGTIAVFCLLNFPVWMHYFPVYLYFPFLGWLVWEAMQARGKWRTGIIAGTAIAYVLICDWMIRGLIFYGLGQKYLDAYRDHFVWTFCPFFYPIFFLIVVFRRLYFAPSVALPPEREGCESAAVSGEPVRR
ncbi:MAG: glycosyltransferase 87 family protein [Verrucomicrobiota bacterium]